MSLLLDTQALLWFLLDDARLTNKSQNRHRRTGNTDNH